MIIFLFGQDTYRSRQKLNEIVEHYKKIHKSGLNLRHFDFGVKDIEDLKNEAQTISMFKEKKLIILKNIFAKQDKSIVSVKEEEFLDFAKKTKNSEDTFLIYEEREIKKSSHLFKFLKSDSQYQEFECLQGLKLKNWLQKEFQKQKASISPNALQKLLEYAGNDLWQLSNEVQKLASFKPKARIETEDVELLVRPKITPEIFKTIDAIAAKDKKKALELLHKHLENGDAPLYLLSMINFQFRNLLMVKDLMKEYDSPYLLSKKIQLHPYVLKKSCQQAQKFTIEELKKIYQKIFQIDLSMKTGKTDPKAALNLFITEI